MKTQKMKALISLAGTVLYLHYSCAWPQDRLSAVKSISHSQAGKQGFRQN